MTYLLERRTRLDVTICLFLPGEATPGFLAPLLIFLDPNEEFSAVGISES